MVYVSNWRNVSALVPTQLRTNIVMSTDGYVSQMLISLLQRNVGLNRVQARGEGGTTELFYILMFSHLII